MAIGSWTSTADRIPVSMPIASIWLMELQSPVVGHKGPDIGAAAAVIPNLQGRHSLVSCERVQICNLWTSLLAA
jgi:hypothetical protein